jgi:hypothetical protein
MNNRYTLGVIAAIALAGCGGSGRGATGAVPQSVAVQTGPHKASSSYGDLLYVLTNYGITLVSYPDLQVVGNITSSERAELFRSYA